MDQDNDGFPGMTIRLKGAISGDLYMVQRSWTQFQSMELTEERITGHIVWGDEQVHLGSSNEVLRSVAVESWVKEDPTAHTFELVRASGATCTSILSERTSLFGL